MNTFNDPIKSTFYIVYCLFVRFYIFVRLLLLLGFFIPWKISVHLYCVCQIRIFYVINTIVTDMGHGTDRDIYHVHWSVPRPLDSLYILILPSISVNSILITLLCVTNILCNYNTRTFDSRLLRSMWMLCLSIF